MKEVRRWRQGKKKSRAAQIVRLKDPYATRKTERVRSTARTVKQNYPSFGHYNLIFNSILPFFSILNQKALSCPLKNAILMHTHNLTDSSERYFGLLSPPRNPSGARKRIYYVQHRALSDLLSLEYVSHLSFHLL